MNSYTRDLLQNAICGPVKGLHIPVRPDFFLLPEYALALIQKDLDALGGRRVPAESMMVVADHFAPPSTIERAEILQGVVDYCARTGLLGQLRMMEGICHQLVLEDPRIQAGSIVIGSDSHTVTAGALGAFAAGFGSRDLLYALRTGQIWVQPPAAIAVRLTGSGFSTKRSAKDAILALFGQLGPEGFHRRSIEFFSELVAPPSLGSRATMCNMVVDGGATNGVFVPYAYTSKLAEVYHHVIEINSDQLSPMVACPGSPFAIAPLKTHLGTKIHQAYLGSCNAGRVEDFLAAAEQVDGRKVAPGIRAVAVPASQQVYQDLLGGSALRTLVAAGFVIANPSCGACGGIDKGVLGKGDVCIATMNRNFQGRMGSAEAKIWLASPAVVAASSVAGCLAEPR